MGKLTLIINLGFVKQIQWICTYQRTENTLCERCLLHGIFNHLRKHLCEAPDKILWSSEFYRTRTQSMKQDEGHNGPSGKITKDGKF